MKVLIVGPQKSQATMLEREFPGLDLRFTRKTGGRSTVIDSGLVNSSDRIIVWTNFVDHVTQQNLPRAKVTPVRGGMTKLRELLQSWDAANRVESQDPARMARVKAAPHTGVHNMDLEPSSVKQTCDGERVYFETLNADIAKSMQPGDKVYFRKPHDDDYKRWKQSIHNKLFHYRKAYNIALEYQFLPNEEVELTLPVVATVEPAALPPEEPSVLKEFDNAIKQQEQFYAHATAADPVEIFDLKNMPIMWMRSKELSSADIKLLRTDPRSMCTEEHIMDEHIGWLFRAWDVLTNPEKEDG